MSIIKNITTSVRTHWRLVFSLLFFIASAITITIFAAPSASPYTPGETLDPTCTPGSTNCTVGILESRDEGTNLTYQTKALDFVGAGVVATESGGITTVTISGGVSSAIESLNGLTGSTQTFSTGTTGSDFNIDSTGTVHTFNFPDASASARGLLTTTDWTTFNSKQDALSFSSPLQNIANTISMTVATLSTDGYLTSADWGAFSSKLESSDFVSNANDNANGISVSISNQLLTTSMTVTVTIADMSNTGVLSSADWSMFNNKESALTFSTGLTRSINTITNNLSTGVSGGQSVVGGVASGENLILSSTSDATKGSILFGNSVYDEANNRMAIGTTSFNGTNPEKLLVDAGVTSSVNVFKGTGSINSYLQLNIQNTSTGTGASSDVVATADNGTETTGFIDMGINGSNYTGGVMGGSNDAYLYNIGAGSGGNLLIGAGSSGKSLYFLTGGTSQAANTRMQIDATGNATFTQGVSSSGSPVALTVTGAAHTGLTASTEANDIKINLARTVQFATGALATQRAFLVQAPTYGFAGASTITDAATMAITGAPIKGTNATITNSHGLLIQAGAVSTAASAYGLTVNAPTGATTNIAAQFLDAATMSGTETFYPAIDASRSGGSEGVRIGYWSRVSGTADSGAVMGRSNSLILGVMSGATPQRALTISYGTNTPSMFFGTTAVPNLPYDFGMSGAIAFYGVPNTTKWAGLVTSGIYTSANGPIMYGSAGVNGSAFGDLVLQSRSLSTTMVGIVTGVTPAVRMKIDSTGNTTFTQGVAATSTSPTAFTLTGAAHLALATSTEASDVNFNLARIVQFNTGALATQRAFRIQAPTYRFVGSSTITDAATFAVSGAPIAGTNATITNAYSIWSQGGNVRIDGMAASAASDSTVCVSTGGILTKSNAACTAASSLRFKHDITTLDNNTLLAQVMALRPVSFVYNENNALSLGFIAEEVNAINPLLVAYEDDGITPRALHYDKFVTLLTGAVQELDLKIVPLTDLSTDTPQSFGSLMKQFLENANNTLQEVFFGKVHTKELCLDDVCITKTQLQQLLQQQNVQPSQNGGGSNNSSGSGSTDGGTTVGDVTPPAEENTGGDSGTPPPTEEISGDGNIVSGENTGSEDVTPPPTESNPPEDIGTPPPADVPVTSSE